MQKSVARRTTASALSLLFLTVGLSVAVTACGGGGGGDGGGDGGAGAPPPVAPPPVEPPATSFQSFAAAAAVFGQQGFESAGPNGGADMPSGATLFDPASIAVADDGKVFIADTANQRVLVLAQVPDGQQQGAAFVVGQPDALSGGDNGLPDGFASPNSVSVRAGRMVVADTSAHRVLIYEAVPTDFGARPTVVVGQPNMDSRDPECDGFSLNGPRAAYVTPQGKLIVADTGNSRVLIWNSVPTVEEQGRRADTVLGQSSFGNCAPNRGGGFTPHRNTLRAPDGIWSDDTRLAVVDSGNHRVLLWDDIRGIQLGQNASRVLGQADFDSAVRNGPQDDSLEFPRAVAADEKHLAVSDGQNRVLIWNGWPAQDGQAANVVLGQRDFLRNDLDNSFESAQSLDSPYGITFHQGKLLVIDQGNNRLLVFKQN
ncbi:NHL repeat-containing protein [Ramlibacter sp. Leaf400]|uniref:NHL repeat-containing protein n=1 Tax=Ramlibacter sp. Leaf400 TaxID=1736365 RepID=UPI0006F8D84B|nr:NHL repeat-containing protein [Ramlibacter sp. Leaf400]KQT12245.1 hypothetical protein ASG30_02795 [Ramlibacter sp. Leaf400]